MSIRVVIVEDEKEIRELTARLLAMYEDIDCVATFESAEIFSSSLPKILPDVVLMDITLPNQTSIECIRQVHPQYPAVEFVMFTSHNDTKKVFDALAAGATGYVLKGGTPENLAAAIREVKNGGSPMTRSIARLVTNSFNHPENEHTEFPTLTKQEKEILNDLNKGWSYKEIAAQRFISTNTVRSHIRHIYEKLQVHSAIEALNKLHKR